MLSSRLRVAAAPGLERRDLSMAAEGAKRKLAAILSGRGLGAGFRARGSGTNRLDNGRPTHYADR